MKTIGVIFACALAYVSAVSFPTMQFTDSATDSTKACLNLTTCEPMEVGESFYLPYCAKFLCVAGEGGAKIEQIQFCNNVPLDNQNCEVTNPENATLPFPHCCPIFSCDNVQFQDDATTQQALGDYRSETQKYFCPALFPELQGQGQEGQGQGQA